jgi:Uncharacterized conserved protein
MTIAKTEVKTLTGLQPNAIPDDLLQQNEPFIVRGLVSDWPLVQAGRQSAAAAMQYIEQFYSGKPVVVYSCAPEKNGQFFYDESCTALDFEATRAPLTEVLNRLLDFADKCDAPGIYVGSTTIDTWLPGFRAENDLNLAHHNPLVSLWLGNRSRIAAHFDAPNNIACCVVGKRRFTLFPPEQVGNLYVGPLHFTPSGQAISLVDFANPDLQKFPRFAEAMEHAQVAELSAGDVLFIPSMWWHHVEALDDFNVLVNYWWRQAPLHADLPLDVLYHAMLSIRDLAPHEKQAWKAIFDHYIFSDQDHKYDHIPDQARGFLSPLDDDKARRLRSWLINKLNR